MSRSAAARPTTPPSRPSGATPPPTGAIPLSSGARSRFRRRVGRALAPLAGRASLAATATLALAALLAGCGGSDRAELTVLAASSLTGAFDRLEADFEAEHPDIDVVLSYDSSAILAQQVIAGAPADVLATADTETMGQVVDAAMIEGEPTVFARNTMVIVTPAGNPADIASLADLTDATVAVCVPEAPCGAAARELLERSDVGLEPATEEDNVSSVLTKVTGGEVDAGITYVTDARAAGDQVETVEIEHSDDVVNDDPIAIVAGADETDAAREWIDLILSPAGQRALSDVGFQTVSAS